MIKEPAIGALDRLCYCYPENPGTSWTGRRKTQKRKSKRRANNPTTHASPEPRTSGHVTRAMAHRLQENN